MKKSIKNNLELVSEILNINYCRDGYNFFRIIRNVSPKNTEEFIKYFVDKNPFFTSLLLKERGFSKESIYLLSKIISMPNKNTYWSASCGEGLTFHLIMEDPRNDYEKFYKFLEKGGLIKNLDSIKENRVNWIREGYKTTFSFRSKESLEVVFHNP